MTALLKPGMRMLRGPFYFETRKPKARKPKAGETIKIEKAAIYQGPGSGETAGPLLGLSGTAKRASWPNDTAKQRDIQTLSYASIF